jgi:hypothetical protein
MNIWRKDPNCGKRSLRYVPGILAPDDFRAGERIVIRRPRDLIMQIKRLVEYTQRLE